MYLLAIDLGTSAVKALVVAPDGRVVGKSAASYPTLRTKRDWAEQDPEAWWTAVKASVRKTLSKLHNPAAKIAAIGLSGQMHGTILLDAAGMILWPAVIWQDQRSKSQAWEIQSAFETGKLISISGSPATPGFQVSTLRWFKQRQPSIWRNVAAVLTPKDYLHWRLTGLIRSEPSDASGTGLFDICRRDWSDEITDKLGIGGHLLAPIGESSEAAGTLNKDSADDLGLNAGIKVVIGAADTAAGILGAGLQDQKSLLVTFGTGGQIVHPRNQPQVDAEGRIHTFCSVTSGDSRIPDWYMIAAILSAGLSLRWLHDSLLGLDRSVDLEEMISWAADSPPGADGLIFLPYLVGERSPLMDPNARGILLGLTANHERADLVRAVMEGVVFAAYDAYQVLTKCGSDPREIIMAGGGAKSDLWRQMVADMFRLPVRRLMASDHSATGASILAGIGVGILNIEDAADWAMYGPYLEPDRERADLYQELFQIFRDTYSSNRDALKRLNETGSAEKRTV